MKTKARKRASVWGRILAGGSLGAITMWSLVALAAQSFSVDASVDQRAFTGDGDWDVGRTKAECSSSGRVTGISTNPNNGIAHSILCETMIGGNSNYVTVDYALGDRRRDTSTGDWDVGFTKGECGLNERVVGISEDPVSGQLSRIQCAKAGFTGACHAVVFSSGDNRGNTSTGDWAPGFFKGECGPGEMVKGVSKSFCGGSPHAILCCAESFPL